MKGGRKMANVKEIDIGLFFEPEKLTEDAQIEMQEMLGFCALPWTGISAQIEEMTVMRHGEDQRIYALTIRGEEAIPWKSLDKFVRALRDSHALILRARARDVGDFTDWEYLGESE